MFGTSQPTPTVTLDPGVHNDTVMPDLSVYFRSNPETDKSEYNTKIDPSTPGDDNWVDCPAGAYQRFAATDPTIRRTIGSIVHHDIHLQKRFEEQSQQLAKRESEAHAAIAAIGERLIQESNDRRWCSEFDEIIDDVNSNLPIWLQLPTREREYEVCWTETYTVTVRRSTTVTARNDEQACEIAADSYIGEADEYEMRQAISSGDYEFSDDNGDFEAAES